MILVSYLVSIKYIYMEIFYATSPSLEAVYIVKLFFKIYKTTKTYNSEHSRT